ncbi:MAG: hypothetical protein J6T57_03755 [Alphaproteobacteria bacterium]|nr:hypothetical protein [Alphaproteobacteria bacterium]
MRNKVITLAFAMMIAPTFADALSYKTGGFNFGLTGYGMAGILEPNFEKPDFIDDFRVRAQATYEGMSDHIIGAAFMVDEIAVDEDKWWHEAFAFWQWRGVGRIEFGLTDSVAHKLGLGLPDVGGLRVNDDSLVYRKMGMRGSVIANPEITIGSEALRLNIVSATSPRAQYGISVSGITGDYDYGVDVGAKIKLSNGKTKYALSLGASFIDHPEDYATDTFTPKITADYRAQAALGLNIQYNSFIFAINTRAIYDENPVDLATDGIMAGTGVSYDILNYSLSLSYMFSETGIWHSEYENNANHTVVASFRYKYSKYVDGWASIGMTRDDPFVAAGLRLTF